MTNPKLKFEPMKSDPKIYLGKCDHPECRYANEKGALLGFICHRGAKATESMLSMSIGLPNCSGSNGNWHPVRASRSPITNKLEHIEYKAEMIDHNEVR